MLKFEQSYQGCISSTCPLTPLFLSSLCVRRLTHVYAMDDFLASWFPVGISNGKALTETWDQHLFPKLLPYVTGCILLAKSPAPVWRLCPCPAIPSGPPPLSSGGNLSRFPYPRVLHDVLLVSGNSTRDFVNYPFWVCHLFPAKILIPKLCVCVCCAYVCMWYPSHWLPSTTYFYKLLYKTWKKNYSPAFFKALPALCLPSQMELSSSFLHIDLLKH